MTFRAIFMIAPLLLPAACEIGGDVNITAGPAGDGEYESSGLDSTGSTTTDQSDSTTITVAETGSSTAGTTSTTSGSSSESGDTGITPPACLLEDDPENDIPTCGCEDALAGSHDWWLSGCCTKPFGTCSDWCLDHGFGECLMVAVTTDAATCLLDAPDIHLDYCDVDVWAVLQKNTLGIQCICAPA
jgi:hypothetical protein